MRHPDRKLQRGSALIFVVILLTVMAVGSTAMWRYLHFNGEHGRRVTETAKAIHLAEAGLEKAIAALREQGAAYQGETNTALGDGRFSIRVQPTAETGAWTLRSTGELTDGQLVLKRVTLKGALKLSSSGAVAEYHWSRDRGEDDE